MSTKFDFEIDSETSIDISTVLESATNYTEDDVDIILIKKNHELLSQNEPSYMRLLWGRTMLDWVKLGLGGKVNLVEDGPTLDVVKPKLSTKPITLVAFADTPLLFFELVVEMLNEVNMDGGKIKNFGGAYMGATNQFREASALPIKREPRWESLEYMRHVTDFVSLSNAERELHDRIVYSYMKKGVYFQNPETTLVDTGIEFGKNVTIGPGNVISGKVKVGNNVKLQANNVIENCTIGDNVELLNCVVKNSKIDNNCKVKPFSVIENEKGD